MIVGCYTMHLYCDHRLHPKAVDPRMNFSLWSKYERLHGAQFTGKTEFDCKRQARAKGWRFTYDADHQPVCFCPECTAGRFLLDKRGKPDSM